MGLGTRPRPPDREVGARRSDAGRDRRHRHDARGAGQPQDPRRPARGLSRRQRRLQPGPADDARHPAEAPRWPPLRSPRQRSRRAGALRRRDPRDLVGHRPPRSRIHIAVRSAGRDPRRRAVAFRNDDVARHLRGTAAGRAAAAASAAPAPAPRRVVEARLRASAARRRAPPRRRAVLPLPRARRRARVPRAPAPAPASTRSRSTPATRCRRSRRARSAKACRSTRCWWRCSAPTRAPSSGENMNRLKAGVVLSVPSAETAQAINGAEARKTIVAQSADFGAYRQRLASSTLAGADRAERASVDWQGPGFGRGSQDRRRADTRQADLEQGRLRPVRTNIRRRQAVEGARAPGRRCTGRRAEQEPQRSEEDPGCGASGSGTRAGRRCRRRSPLRSPP